MENENRALSLEEIKSICQLLDDGKFEDETSPVEYDGQMTFITVDEDIDDGCIATYSCAEDTARSSVSMGEVTHTITVGDYVFDASENEYGLQDLYVPASSSYSLPSDQELLDMLKKSIVKNWESTDFYGCCEASDLFENEWTHDEIVEEIMDQLTCESYIKVEDKIFPLEDVDAESFMDEYCDFDDERERPDYTVLTPRQVAEELAENIDLADEY